jgi:hypothetical protein
MSLFIHAICRWAKELRLIVLAAAQPVEVLPGQVMTMHHFVTCYVTFKSCHLQAGPRATG